ADLQRYSQSSQISAYVDICPLSSSRSVVLATEELDLSVGALHRNSAATAGRTIDDQLSELIPFVQAAKAVRCSSEVKGDSHEPGDLKLIEYGIAQTGVTEGRGV